MSDLALILQEIEKIKVDIGTLVCTARMAGDMAMLEKIQCELEYALDKMLDASN